MTFNSREAEWEVGPHGSEYQMNNHTIQHACNCGDTFAGNSLCEQNKRTVLSCVV